MSLSPPGPLVIAMLIIIGLCIAATGCIGIPARNLTEKELSDTYLAHTGTCRAVHPCQ
ncbi:MAG: hypothetical protein M0Q91_17195 [Methanoregula sp.]|nr:hypothetical protein [Methanoregula sp.]